MAKWRSGARGRSGGGFGGGRGRGNNRRGGCGHSYSDSNGSIQDDFDIVLQSYDGMRSPHASESSASSRGRGIPAYRGRGRLVPLQLSSHVTFPGKRRGFDIPRRQARGIGTPKNARRVPLPVGAKQTLSSLLHQERPLLKPVVFVPSTKTKFLFQNEEELLQPIVEDVDDTVQSPIPTADRVTRVFSGGNIPPGMIWDNDDGTDDEIEVVDFDDVGKLFQPKATTSNTAIPKPKNKSVPKENMIVHEELVTRNGNQETGSLSADIGNLAEIVDEPLGPPNGIGLNLNDLFYVDTRPNYVPNGLEFPSSVLPGDDIIVYDAPHPRNTSKMSGREKESIEEVTNFSTANDRRQGVVDMSEFSFHQRPLALPRTLALTTAMAEATTATATDTSATSSRLRVPPITTPRQAKLWKSKLSRASKQAGTSKTLRKPAFSAFGTMREESLLRRLDGERDVRYSERRRGDSDLEWGDTTDDDDADVVVGKMVVEQGQGPDLDQDMKRVLGMLEKGKGRPKEILNQANNHGMEVDVDIDIASLERFVRGLTGADAGAHVTMDDIECEDIVRMEDEGDEDVGQRGSSGSEDEDGETADEDEEALRIEEGRSICDGGLRNIDGVDDEKTDGLGECGNDDDGGLGEDDDDPEDEDEDYQDSSFQLKLNRLRMMGGGGVVDGDFDDEDDLLQRNMTLADQDEAFIRHLDDVLDDKYKDPPPDQSLRFELDRQKKAYRKRERELKRLAIAADPLSKKKGGKKGRKAMLTAAAVDPTITVFPNRVIDMTTLVQQIRRFVADAGFRGPSSMSLPPTDRETRKNVHEIAAAFNLKSVSKGKGNARYTTFTKTTRTGIQVNEGKIARIVRRSRVRGDSFILEDKKGKGVSRVPKHKEGDIVGMAAPKLDESNVGFRLLAMMGWSEGDRIGASTNGLEVPLSAIIKTSKLGLGARK